MVPAEKRRPRRQKIYLPRVNVSTLVMLVSVRTGGLVFSIAGITASSSNYMPRPTIAARKLPLRAYNLSLTYLHVCAACI